VLAGGCFHGDTSIDALILRAAIAIVLGNDRHAAKDLLRTVITRSRAQHGGAWLLLACALAEQGSVTDARAALTQALRQPEARRWHAALWLAEARAQMAGGEVAPAQESLAKALAAAEEEEDAALVRCRPGSRLCVSVQQPRQSRWLPAACVSTACM
jgi:Tfp pilus assembly protein PilF